MVVWKYSTISQHLYQTAGNIYCVLHLVISPPAPFYPLLDAETKPEESFYLTKALDWTLLVLSSSNHDHILLTEIYIHVAS